MVAIWNFSSSGNTSERAKAALPSASGTSHLNYSTPFIVPGLMQPHVDSADQADVPDDGGVLGIVVDGQARAYVLRAMSGMSSRVVNDLIGGIPVTVIYCDQTDCARVLTSKTRGKPIDVWIGGWTTGMAVRLNEQMYLQTSPDLPLDDLPFERTTWGDWKERYPASLVFTGRPPPRRSRSIPVPNSLLSAWTVAVVSSG